MPATHTIGLLGFDRIDRSIYDQIRAHPEYELGYVFVRSPKEELPRKMQIFDVSRLSEVPVNLCVEVATPEVAAEVGPTVLEASDLAVLSGGALSDPDVKGRLTSSATENGTTVVLLHAALLGIDGLVDAREALTEVDIETVKHPNDIGFGFTDEFRADDISGRTMVYDGSVRELCRLLPRSFHSHAVVALPSLGLDETRSTLVADPDADRSTRIIRASGDQFSLVIERESAIGDVEGDYTHITVWGSIRRLLNTDEPLTFV